MTEGGLTLGTAGHIDHGKTTLIKALTGKDTDRLQEEKERGISIELGYAELRLPSGRTLSVVDAPGHERFVKNMVAGATGIDIFLLVVAADDGVMPQTREHLHIIELLDIPLGVVALTKVDAVEKEMVDLATADVEDLLVDSPYETAPIISVSGVTGQGLPELSATLDELAAKAEGRGEYPATRMPVDRVFSLKGIGTVVTGTLWSGELRTEDTVVILPSSRKGASGREMGEEVRIRSIQVHDRDVDSAQEGQRVALNLTGADKKDVERGRWVVKNPAIAPTYLIDVRVELLRDAAASLERVSRVRVDHGTQEVLAKMVLADRELLAPGESCYAQIRVEERVLAHPGDHFIVRSLSPVTTIGGGKVLDPKPRKHGTAERWRDRLNVLEEGPGRDITEVLLKEEFPGGITRSELERSPYLWRFDAAAAVREVLEQGAALEADQERLFSAPELLAVREEVLQVLQSRAGEDPLDPYVSVGDIRRRVSGGKEWPALEAALAALEKEGEIVRTEHGLRWGEAQGGLEGEDAERAEEVWERFRQAGVEVPTVAVVAAELGITEAAATRLVQVLQRQGRMVKVGGSLYYSAEGLQELIARISEEIAARGEITLAEVRDLFGTSRKYAQALVEHMDSEGLTLRVGDARRLRKKRKQGK